MDNPFNKEKQPTEYEFFRQLTDAIGDWMVKRYPEFDSNLEKKIGRLSNLQHKVEMTCDDFGKEIKKERQSAKEYMVHEINDWLTKEHPGISKAIKKDLKDVENLIAKHGKNVKEIDEKLKNFKSSQTLCEDVYAMRDEFKEMKKFMEGFTNKIKKVFET